MRLYITFTKKFRELNFEDHHIIKGQVVNKEYDRVVFEVEGAPMVRCHCKSKKGTSQRRMSQNIDYQRSQSKRKIKIFSLHLILGSQQYYPDSLNELT